MKCQHFTYLERGHRCTQSASTLHHKHRAWCQQVVMVQPLGASRLAGHHLPFCCYPGTYRSEVMLPARYPARGTQIPLQVLLVVLGVPRLKANGHRCLQLVALQEALWSQHRQHSMFSRSVSSPPWPPHPTHPPTREQPLEAMPAGLPQRAGRRGTACRRQPGCSVFAPQALLAAASRRDWALAAGPPPRRHQPRPARFAGRLAGRGWAQRGLQSTSNEAHEQLGCMATCKVGTRNMMQLRRATKKV